MLETWLVAVLRGEYPRWEFDAGFDGAQILDAAQREGVVALLHDRLLDVRLGATVPATVRDAIAAAARGKAAQSLHRLGQAQIILSRLRDAGIPALLLKGSALAYWAYASPYLRECSDIDLLLRSRADVDRVAPILAELRYVLRERVLPGDLVCYEVTCARSGDNDDGLEVDLHWRLSSTPMFAFRFDWAELEAGAIALPAVAPNARGLAPLPAYLHACMHRVQNMSIGCADRLKWLFDLVVLGRKFSPAEWDDLAQSAIARGLAGVCLAGTRAATTRFGEFAPESICRSLHDAARHEAMDVTRMGDWWYIQRMNFLAFPSLRLRLSWLRQRVVPDLAYLRERYGAEGGLGRALVARSRAMIKRWRG